MSLYLFRNNTESCFKAENAPRLVFVSDVEIAYSKMARPLHGHDGLVEIAFVYQGQGTHLIGSRSYPARRGDVLLYNAGVVHDDDSLPDTTESMICLGFRGLSLVGLPENHIVAAGASALLRSGAYETELEMLFRLIHSQAQENHAFAEDFCNAMLSAILLLLRQMQSGKGQQAEAEHELVGAMKAYIDKNYAEALTLGSVAEAFYINPYYASHIFKAIMGYSPIQYITRRRIGEAQSLLIFTKSSVTEIAARVGYDNPNYFSTVFTKLVGMSPVKYRQSWIADPEG